MFVALRLKDSVKIRCVFLIFDARVEVRTAPEPPPVRRPEHACIHVHSRDMRVVHMRNQADTRSPKARVIPQAFHIFARRHCRHGARAQCAMHSGHIDTDLLKDPAPAHHAHETTSCIAAILRMTFGLRHIKSSGCIGALVAVFQIFKRSHDIIAQLPKPRGSAGFALIKGIGHSNRPTVVLRIPNTTFDIRSRAESKNPNEI